MNKSLAIVLVFLFTLLTTISNAQDASVINKLDDYFHQIEKNNKAMGGILITKDGKQVYEKYIGFSSVQDNTRNSHLTRFRIGSITKTFTSVILFQLIEEGKVTSSV